VNDGKSPIPMPEKRPDWSGAADEALLLAVGTDRDRAAFVELFGRYAGKVKAFLIRAGAPAGIAEDAAQEVMVTLWRRAATFDPTKAGAATWIFAIARNRRIDMARRQIRAALDTEDPLFQPEPASSAESSLAGADRDARVRNAIATLTPAQRDVIALAFFTGLSHGDIAVRLDLPLGTVKSRLRLSFSHLRQELGADFAMELNDD
jgi:RNA polymerase sigma-70 factor (ECF subfamily)